MIATLIALVFVAIPPEEPKPLIANPLVTRSTSTATFKVEAARKKQQRNRLRALNSRRLAGIDGPGLNSSRGSNPVGTANFGGDSLGSGGSGNPGWSMMGGDRGAFGGGWADQGMTSSFEQQLAATLGQAQGAMAAGQAAAEMTASLS